MGVPEAVRVIQDAIDKGNFGRADLLCRRTMEALPDFPWAPMLFAKTALKIGEVAASQHWCAETKAKLAEHPPHAFPEIQTKLETLAAELSSAVSPKPAGGYLLIKSWGYGFWPDVEQVLGALLLAEMTRRTPVVHWGGNSYFTDDPSQDAFGTFFEPIASASLEEIAAEQSEFYPPKWHRDNLGDNGLNVWEGEGARLSGLYLLNRPERVVVQDFFTQVVELLPWLSAEHWLQGVDAMEAIRQLYEKYFVLQLVIQAEIDAFITENFDGRPTFAVHVRNMDKGREDPNVLLENADMLPVLDAQLAQNPDLRLFLLTDSETVVAQYAARYGDRVFSTDCARTDGIVPLTWKDSESRYRLGVEVIKDAYIAAACDNFIGYGGSSVACMVACLKRWPEGTCRLIGDNIKIRRNWLLHDW